MTDEIYILLPVHNRREITRRFVKCLKMQTYRHYHLVLIDDGSIDGTEEMVRGEIGECTVLKGKGNWWWAGSLQQGYLWLKKQKTQTDDIVLIINDDTEFERNFLETGASLLARLDKTLLIAHCYDRLNNKLLDAGVHVDWKRLSFSQASTPEQINCLSTRGLFMRVRDFLTIGGFYPRLLPHYSSDYEYTIRARRRGMKLTSDPSLKLWLDQEATGYHKIQPVSLVISVKKIFSKKSVYNPLMWTSFILLSCPWRWKLKHLARVWKNAVRHIIREVTGRCLPAPSQDMKGQ